MTKGQHDGEKRQAVSGMCYLNHADHLDKRIALNMTAEKTNKAFFSGCQSMDYKQLHLILPMIPGRGNSTPLGALLIWTHCCTESVFIPAIHKNIHRTIVRMMCEELKNSLKIEGRYKPDSLALYYVIINIAFIYI